MIQLLLNEKNFVAVSKPIGIASIPERDLTVPSLQKSLEAKLGTKLFVVHRLDKEVSGVLLFAKNAKTHRFLSMAFESRTITKVYRAVLCGDLETSSGIINAPIRQFGSGRMGVDAAQGKPSVTAYTVLDKKNGCTSVEARPETGRRHQLRVHFYSLGHPIAGDPLYGDKTIQATFPRLLLHAESVAFTSENGHEFKIVAPLPIEFDRMNTALQ